MELVTGQFAARAYLEKLNRVVSFRVSLSLVFFFPLDGEGEKESEREITSIGKRKRTVPSIKEGDLRKER